METQPRQQYYTFAHRVLKQDALEEHKLWSFITGDKADGYAQMRWHDAGEAAGESHKPDKLLWVAPIREGDIEIALLHMPPPQAPTEAYYAAFVRTPQQPFPLRYFVCERSTSGGAFWSEWRTNMRIRGADVPEWPADMAKRVALPLPYAAAFVESILAEVKAFPSVVDTPAAKLSAAKPAPKSNPRVTVIVVCAIALALLGLLMLAR